jgi:membrane protein DedA with SNARE-associated domain
VERTKFSVKLITFLAGFHGVTAYALIFGVLLSCGLGVPLPEDITIISAGILAALKSIKFPGALLVCFLGVLAGDSFLFFMGRIYGYRIFRLPGFRSIFTESRIQIARTKVLRNSKFICFTGRFLPGLRAPIFLTAGIMGVHPFVFLILDGSAAMISVPVWVYVGWLFGSNLDQALAIALKTQKYFIGAVVLLFLVYLWFKAWAARRERKLLQETEKPPIPSELGEE